MFLWIIEHILNAMPIMAWPAIALAAAIVVIVSRIFRLVPFAELISWAAILVCLFSVFMWGSAGTNMLYQEQIEEAKARVAAAEAESEELNQKLDKAIKNKNYAIVELRAEFQKQVNEIAKQIDSSCKVDPLAVQSLNNVIKKGNK